MACLSKALFGVVELWAASSIFQCVQLAEFGARMRSDRKMWLLMVNGGRMEMDGDVMQFGQGSSRA